MTWKCPKCSYKTKDYRVMQRHWSAQHSKKKEKMSKGKEKRVYVYHPPKPPRR